MAGISAIRVGQLENASLLGPTQGSILWTLRDGVQVEIRLIQPGDEQRMIKFHQGLSARSVLYAIFRIAEPVCQNRACAPCADLLC
jgi:hypothetical protein